MNVLFPSPSLFPPSPPPVAIIEPTTTSAVSSPGQYMSPCCTPNQQRGPLPHTNLSQNPLLHLDLFQLAGWNAYWVYSFIVCLYLFFCISVFFFCNFGMAFIQSGYIYFLQPVSLQHPAPSLSLQTPPPPLGANSSVIKWLFHIPLGADAFHNTDGFVFFSLWLSNYHSAAPQHYLNAIYIKGRTLLVVKGLGLLFARRTLCCLCTFIIPSQSNSLSFCLNSLISITLIFLSVLSSIPEQSVGALPSL